MEVMRKVVAGLVALAAALGFHHASHAGAPIQKGQAPGCCRMMLGDFEIVALSDGTKNLDVRRARQECTRVEWAASGPMV